MRVDQKPSFDKTNRLPVSESGSLPRESDAPRCRAFTLIELLTVVSIILLLAALLTPAVMKLIKLAARQKAATQIESITHAIKQYEVTYGKWPGQTMNDSDGSITPAQILTNLVDNPRRETFLEYPPDWVSASGVFQDRWDQEIYIAMDENRDGRVDVDHSYAGSTVTTNVLNESVAIFSWGPNPSEERDRIFSWLR